MKKKLRRLAGPVAAVTGAAVVAALIVGGVIWWASGAEGPQ